MKWLTAIYKNLKPEEKEFLYIICISDRLYLYIQVVSTKKARTQAPALKYYFCNLYLWETIVPGLAD